jgi:hypothetical protein
MSREDPDLVGCVIDWPPGSGTAIQNYGSAYLDMKEIVAVCRSTTLLKD